jgi:hypothetical protein
MCRAITEAHAVDEVKDIRDKARAIEMYARQARNTEAERQACEIRLRAERRCGEIYAMAAKAIGARGNPGGQGAPIVRSDNVTTQTLADLGISKQQSSDWQRLAAIPREVFEADLADRMWRPTTGGLLDRQDARERGPLPPPLAGDEDALWLWGVLIDFEERGRLLKRDPNELIATPMHDHMRDTLYELAPKIAAWLGRIKT